MTEEQSGVPSGGRWHVLLQPRWLAWHSFVLAATVGMLLLGDWQLHRAKSGNELSWAYTFEWPLFAAFTVYFWIKSLRDELRQDAANADRAGPAVATPGQEAGVAPEAGVPIVDVRRATPADGEAYVARLTAEVQRHGRWHGWR